MKKIKKSQSKLKFVNRICNSDQNYLIRITNKLIKILLKKIKKKIKIMIGITICELNL